jgi:hypothetical protein
MNKKMDTLNSTIETLQSQVTGLRSVVRQQSEQIATLTKPQPATIPPRFNHNFQTYPYNRYNRYNKYHGWSLLLPYSIPRPGVSYHQYLNLFLKFAVKCPENL